MVLLFQLLFITNSHAILGAYIPESEHIPQACKIYADSLLHQVRQIDPISKKQIGKWETDFEEMEMDRLENERSGTTDSGHFFCSGTLIGPHEVASASHCSQLIINANAAHYDYIEIPMGMDDDRIKEILKKVPLKYAIQKEIIKIIEEKVLLLVAKRSIMTGKIFAECGVSTDHPETRELKWENSWPHPRMKLGDAGAVTIDSGIYRTTEPYTLTPMRTAKTYAETIALLRNTKSCRAFGFGIDNEKKFGKLHGVRIYQYNNVSEYIIMSQTHFNGTMFGDSGGTLTCTDPKGVDVLVGSVQGGQPINPKNWMGSKQDFHFTPMSYGPVKRWHEFVRSLPIESMHCGEKPCNKGHPILNEYVSTFDAVNELNGLTQDLHDIIDIYKPYYSKSLFAGYKSLFKQVEAAHEDILGEYNDWKTKSPIIHGKTLSFKQRIVHGQPIDIRDVVLGEPFEYKYSETNAHIYPAYTRMRAYMLMQFLQNELFALRHQGLSLGKNDREILDHAREHYWTYLEKEIAQYNESFKN